MQVRCAQQVSNAQYDTHYYALPPGTDRAHEYGYITTLTSGDRPRPFETGRYCQELLRGVSEVTLSMYKNGAHTTDK